MNRRFALCCFLIALALPAAFVAADSQEMARLVAGVQAGALEVTTGDTVELETYVGDELTDFENDVPDAVSFVLEGITVNDLNGDGRGFVLRAFSEPLVFASGWSNTVLPVGTVVGFRNPSENDRVVFASPNELRYEDGGGVFEFQVDYEIAYDVPQSSPVGLYLGELKLELSAL